MPPELAAKYGVQQDNVQTLLSITNNVTLESTCFNDARTRKPQTFAAGAADAAALDPTGGGGATCDFCNWRSMTAEDTFLQHHHHPRGRVEGRHAVSASNLFKYCEPAQGVVLFKHHDPLSFDLAQLSDLLAVSHRWLQAAAAAQADDRDSMLHPLFVWNCLPRGEGAKWRSGSCRLPPIKPQPPLARAQRVPASSTAMRR